MVSVVADQVMVVEAMAVDLTTVGLTTAVGIGVVGEEVTVVGDPDLEVRTKVGLGMEVVEEVSGS